MFVDASTGQCYPIASSPFLGVESVWNDINYWVCMQMPEPHSDSRATPQQLSLDMADSSKWEYLLPSAAPQVPPHPHSDLETVHLLCCSMLWNSIKQLIGSIPPAFCCNCALVFVPVSGAPLPPGLAPLLTGLPLSAASWPGPSALCLLPCPLCLLACTPLPPAPLCLLACHSASCPALSAHTRKSVARLAEQPLPSLPHALLSMHVHLLLLPACPACKACEQ